MFNIPQKEIIVNDDSQVRLLGSTDGVTFVAYAGGTNLSPSNAAHVAQLEGFLTTFKTTNLQLLASAVRVRKSTPSAGVAESAAFTVTTSGGGKAGDILMLRMDSVDLTSTEFQNRGFEKRYQFSSDQASVANIITHLVATINADKFSPVTAYAGFNNVTPAQDDSAKIVLIAKKVGQPLEIVFNPISTNTITFTRVANGTTVYHTAEDTSTTTAAGASPINTYDYLKNINWAKNLDFDRNMNWMPLAGVSYNSYYFELNGDVQDTVGNEPIVNEKHNQVKVGINVWVKSGLTLDTALDAFVTDMNV